MMRPALSSNVYESWVQGKHAFGPLRSGEEEKAGAFFLYAPATEMWKQEE